MNKSELEHVANSFFIEFPEDATKKEMLAILAENEVTQEQVDGLEEPQEETSGIVTTESIKAAPESNVVQANGESAVEERAAAPVEKDGTVILRFDRQNPTYEIMGYNFSHEHPFQVVKAGDADYIVKNIPGFRPALASEVDEYYS